MHYVISFLQQGRDEKINQITESIRCNCISDWLQLFLEIAWRMHVEDTGTHSNALVAVRKEEGNVTPGKRKPRIKYPFEVYPCLLYQLQGVSCVSFHRSGSLMLIFWQDFTLSSYLPFDSSFSLLVFLLLPPSAFFPTPLTAVASYLHCFCKLLWVVSHLHWCMKRAAV